MSAAVAPPADQTAELLQKLSLDSQAKPLEIPEPTKKTSVYQYGSVDPGNVASGQIPTFERSATPLLQDFVDPNICYLHNGYPSAFYYGGFDASANDWGDDHTRYMNQDGVDMMPGMYGDNGSLMYHQGFGYAPYPPYSPAGSPVPTVGNDSQLYGPQHYQYPHYFQPVITSNGLFTPTPSAQSQRDVSTSTAADQKPLPVETANANSNAAANGGGVKGTNGSALPKQPARQNSFNSNKLPSALPTSGYQDPRYGFDVCRSPVPWVDGSMFSNGQHRPVTSSGINSSFSKANNVPSSRNQNYRSNSHYMGFHHPSSMSGMGAAHGFINRMYPNKLYGQYGNSFRPGFGFGSGDYDLRTNGRWLAIDSKYKPRGRGNGCFVSGNEMDGMNELNRGPRTKGPKNQKGAVPEVSAVKDANGTTEGTNGEEKEKAYVLLHEEQYNRDDFPLDYTGAKFFVIKSYSEDDVHKSIKYNVWASTPGGNKKLDTAYQEAKQTSGSCPVFLFFSVNTSGQFVGLAEMVGPVDFQKNIEYWQQDKWTGCFPVRWHMVKDVPNNSLKHITLENNENKPVTNSRDTQEVKLEQGLKMIKIFKEHSSRTCILDDFEFYEVRQKAIQEKKAKQQQQQIQKQVWEGKPVDEKKVAADVAQKSSYVASDVMKEPTSVIQSNGDLNLSENGSVAKIVDGPKGTKPTAVVSEKRVLANGVANGC